MARKVFVSYKYHDNLVAPLPELEDVEGARGTCRDYVDMTIGILEGVEIYKGEEDGNDLSAFKDTTIKTHLKEKIRDSSVTVIFISKGMKEPGTESEQWIPWEVKYSLLQTTYEGRTSKPNGMLAVIIPDENDSYDHYYQHTGCTHCNTVIHKTTDLFKIIGGNMFNKKQPTVSSCGSLTHNSSMHLGNDYSYIHPVKWVDFAANPSAYIDIAVERREGIDAYNIRKVVVA
jgi:hypothetical protein